MSDTTGKTVVECLAVDSVPQHRTLTLVFTNTVETDTAVVTVHRLTLVNDVQLTLYPRCSVRAYALVAGVRRATRAAVLTGIAVAGRVWILAGVPGVTLS